MSDDITQIFRKNLRAKMGGALAPPQRYFSLLKMDCAPDPYMLAFLRLVMLKSRFQRKYIDCADFWKYVMSIPQLYRFVLKSYHRYIRSGEYPAFKCGMFYYVKDDGYVSLRTYWQDPSDPIRIQV